MNEKQPAGSATGLNLAEILYILFRHKWKVVLGCCLGVVGAVAVPFLRPVPYQSDARLYIRYVMENSAPAQVGDNGSRIRSPDLRGDSILNTELQILTSMDLAKQVADAIGPERVLVKLGGGTNPISAAAAIQNHLTATVPRDTSVVCLSFQHPDPNLVQPVLQRLIEFYFKTHARIHAVGAFDEFLSQETDQRRAEVAQTEEELRNAKAKAGIISLETTKQNYVAELARLQQELFDAQVQLAEHQATANELATTLRVSTGIQTNVPSGTNAVPAVPAQKVDEYRRVCSLLDTLNHRQQELLLTYTPANVLVREVQEQIAGHEQHKRELELANPGLLAVQISTTNGAPARLDDPRSALSIETARVSGLEARVQVLTAQIGDMKKKAVALADVEGPIAELQRRLQLQETNYARFSQSLEQSQIDEKLGAGKVANISTIQEPTPPVHAKSQLMKMIAMVLLGGVALGFGLPFLIEFYLDTSVKRPADIENKLRLPLFVAMPRLELNGNSRRLPWPGKGRALPGSGEGSDKVPADEQHTNGLALAAWDPKHSLRPFYDALRDRLIAFFESNNMTHKPKLVALTGCAQGAGVSSVAAGLAASLSETGEGNVLLVDMSQQEGAAHQFYKGELTCGLEDALATDKRDHALVQNNLYVVSESASNELLPSVLPKRFKNLVPKLKASDYDYIIFDMPPVSPVSLTPRLARFMDTVLIVTEAEKTDCALLKRASALLGTGKTNVGVVLNKTRNYLPRILSHDF